MICYTLKFGREAQIPIDTVFQNLWKHYFLLYHNTKVYFCTFFLKALGAHFTAADEAQDQLFLSPCPLVMLLCSYFLDLTLFYFSEM